MNCVGSQAPWGRESVESVESVESLGSSARMSGASSAHSLTGSAGFQPASGQDGRAPRKEKPPPKRGYNISDNALPVYEDLSQS